MKRLLVFLLLLLAPAAWATTSVTGTLQNLGTGTVGQGAFVRFWLRGCGGNIPRVNGTAVIAPSQGGVYFFDFAAASNGAISGTLYSTRDSTGLLGGDIECGGSHTSVWYGMQIYVGGKGGAEVPVHAKNTATIDISNVTPITTNPVITSPTGDSTYLRLDNGNGPAALEVTTTGIQTLTNKTLTSPVVNGTPSGSGIPTVTLKTGSGAGAYTGTNNAFAPVDTTNLCATITVPTGWKLLIVSSGVLESVTAAIPQSVALVDVGTTCAGAGTSALAGSRRDITPPAIATFDAPFALQYVLAGDGAAHSIALSAATSNIADAWGIQNANNSAVPSIIYILMPSN